MGSVDDDHALQRNSRMKSQNFCDLLGESLFLSLAMISGLWETVVFLHRNSLLDFFSSTKMRFHFVKLFQRKAVERERNKVKRI